jgi:hypothetical protein
MRQGPCSSRLEQLKLDGSSLGNQPQKSRALCAFTQSALKAALPQNCLTARMIVP